MSRRPKNNHYHYAEKYDRKSRLRVSDVLRAPRKAFTLALLVLLAFGLISTTFAAYVSSDDFAENHGSIIVNTRNTRLQREGPAGYDLAQTGAVKDIAPVAATKYYYRGGDNSWSATAMTVSSDGFYAYYYHNSTSAHQFKISTSTTSYNYNKDYVSAGFNGTNISDIGDYGGDNCYCWSSSKHYIIVYYPNTLINTTSNPIICASTSKPDNSPRVSLGTKYNNTDTYHTMTNSSGTWSASVSLTGGRDYEFWFKVVYGTGSSNPTQYYKDQNSATMKYNNCTNWQFEEDETGRGNPKLTTVITGNYQFSFVFSTLKVSVVYPSYTVTSSLGLANAANAPSPASSTKSIGSSVTLTAANPNTGYEFVNWTITSGSATTGSYGGTAFTSSTNKTITVYPTGTSSSVSFTANYKVATFPVQYLKGSGSDITGTNFTENKTYNVAYTISSSTFTRNGYTQEGWSTTENDTSVEYDFGDSYATNAALDLYPVWSIDVPTVTISGTQHTANSATNTTSSTLSNNVTTSASDITPSKTFEIIAGPNGAILPGNTGANCAIDANGAFTASIPGEYTVKLTGSVTNANTTNGTASATATCTVRVVPAKPSFAISLSGASGEGEGTFSEPWKILTGATYTFGASVVDPIPGYKYYWSLTGEDGSWNSFPVSADADNPYQSPTYASNTTPTTTDGRDQITFHSVFANTSKDNTKFKLYMKTEINGMSAQADAVEVWYFIEPLIETFEFMPKQKIYNSLFENTRINVEYNLDNASGYTTTMYFSNDNGSYRPIQRKSDTFISSFENTLKRFFYPVGVKYFKMGITKGTPGTADYLESYLTLHTTVGTSEINGVRPFYFVNNVYVGGERLDLTNKRVVAYWSDSSKASGYSYQTAQDVYKDEEGRTPGVRYRVNLPANAADILFVIEDKDHYGKPAYSNGVFSFSNPDADTILFYAFSEHLTLGDENCYTVNTSNSASIAQLSGSVSFYEAE